MNKFFFAFLLLVSFAMPVAIAEEVAATPAEAPAAVVEKSLYERLGGAPAVTAVVDAFVNKAAGNPAVNFTRQGQPRTWDATPENVEKLKKHLTQFISIATGATDVVYEGKDMKTAHEGMKITNAEFDALAGDLASTLDSFNVPEKEKNELMAIAGSTRGTIVEAPVEEVVEA